MHRSSSRYLAALLLLGWMSTGCDPDNPSSPSNNPPTLDGPTASSVEVLVGDTVSLALEATDPDGDALTFAWSQNPAAPTGRFSDAASSSPTWTAPDVPVDTAYQLNVTVGDARGGTARGSVLVQVRVPAPANRDPSVTAGPTAMPEAVMGSAPITLSVTASDLDGDRLTYAWTQEPASPAGFFTTTATANPIWTSPVVSSARSFTLRVTITDERGGSVQGQVQVDVTPPLPANDPPTLTSGPTSSASSVIGGTSVTLSVTATDPDGDLLSYTWSQTPASPAGAFSSTTAINPTWTAPMGATETDFQLTVMVSDGRGGLANGTVTVKVQPRANRPPVLTSFSASPTEVDEQQPVSLSSSATDSDGDPITYAWTQVMPASPVGSFSSATAANPTWTAPDVNATGVFQLRVTASDGQGGNTPGTIDITVNKVNQPPIGVTVNAPTTLVAGTPYALSITASDPDGDPLSFSWTQTAPATQGTFVGSPTNPNVQWFSPEVGATTSFTLSASVTDGQSAPVVRTFTFPVTVPRYSTDVQPVWSRCTGCHGTSGGLNLTSPTSYANLVNVTANACSPRKRVLPGDPDTSALVQKMEGTLCGGRMPAGEPTYFDNNPHLKVRVRSWILGGALND